LAKIQPKIGQKIRIKSGQKFDENRVKIKAKIRPKLGQKFYENRV